MKRSNPKRRKSEWARAYGSPERVAWIKSGLCICLSSRCAGAVENAHVVNGGKGRKADAKWIVPLCHHHHHRLHLLGYATFERGYEINLLQAACQTEARWLASTGGAAPRTED